jgi:hypothetical protein
MIIIALFVSIYIIEVYQKLNEKLNEISEIVKENNKKLEDLQNKDNLKP